MKTIGTSINFTIKDPDTFMSFFTKKKKFQRSYTIIVYRKNGLIRI